ncbi:MAG: hypothetical protein PHU14_02625 [Methylovulum sp.]|nr:hypothetical protein [Methylovulum sp.]
MSYDHKFTPVNSADNRHAHNRIGKAAATLAALALLGSMGAVAQDEVIVAVPAKAGAVEGKSQNSDVFIWQLLTEFAAPVFPNKSPSPVIFETWASDEDTFSNTPHWPGVGEPKKFHTSLLASTISGQHGIIDAPCNPPTGGAVGNFPTTGTPTPCIAEEVKRNRPQYDYIVKNNLNTQTGLAAAYTKGAAIVMPTESISVKGDWVPVKDLLQWLPNELKSIADVKKQYYTTFSDKVEYALVALHVSSRQNPNWVWGTFEHQLNPGRCDSMGCFDSFGAVVPAVKPDRNAENSQYGACAKTPKLKELMTKAQLSPVWDNYCLKSTQVDYVGPGGIPNVLGNSVIERIVGNGTVAASSCIACHAYASFGANGQPTASATAMLPYNPTGNPLPNVLKGSLQFDFMWGVLAAPAPASAGKP